MELNTELVILKNLLINGEFTRKALPILEKKYFTEIGNQIIFQLFRNYYLKYKQIPNLTEIAGYLQEIPNQEARKKALETINYLKNLENTNNTDYLLDITLKFVKNAIFMEALLTGSDGLTEKDERKIQKAKELMEKMSKVSIDSDLGISFDDVDIMIEYFNNELEGILTQHESINKRLGNGFLPGTLNIIMAAAGIGKSLLMTDLVSGNIINNKNVLLVSMEMRDREIMKRVYANALNLNIHRLTNYKTKNGYTPEEIKAAKEKLKTQGKFYVKDYPAGSFTPLMLDNLLDEYKIEKNIEFDIVYLDYLGIMKSDLVSPSVGLYNYVKSIAEETRAIASKREIPIISASQLNRSATGRNLDVQKVGNESISDSLGTAMTADFILFLLQTPEMKEENLITCKITKNRYTGRTDQFDMNIDYNHMRFYDAVVQDGLGMTEQQVENEIKTIHKEDIEKIKRHDNSIKDGDFDIMKELGL